jgi:recombination protein RecT
MSQVPAKIITVNELRNRQTEFIDKIRAAMPDRYKKEAERFVQMSIIAFTTSSQRDKLEKCKIETFFRSVIEAASYGYALDGKHAYPIPYGNEITCSFDYKALVTCARRAGSIRDARFQVVHKNDEFDWYEENGSVKYRFRIAEDESNRGEIRGAYAVVILPDGTTRFEYMSRSELDKIRRSSKSPDSPAWKNWIDRMFGKAVLKRALQGLDLDLSVEQMIDQDNREYDTNRIIDGSVSTAKTEVMEDLATRLESKLKKEPVAVIEYEEPVDEVEEDSIPDFGLTEDELQEPVEVTPVHRPVAARPVPPRAMPARASSGPSIANHRGTK